MENPAKYKKSRTMITSLLNEALIIRHDPPEKLQELLHNSQITIFDAILENADTALEAQQKILFILSAYSEDSPLIVLRQDSKDEKEGICEFLQIPEYLRKPLYTLSDPIVRRATTQYLKQFAGPLFKSLMFMKIQYQDFEENITNREFGSKEVEGEDEKIVYYYDIKEHGKAIAEHARLAKQIDALEKQLRAQIKQMDGIEEMKAFAREGKESGKIKGARTGNVEHIITQAWNTPPATA